MPGSFLWGVATAAYQVEGGLNGPGQPANNWAGWDRSGHVERCGDALGFWENPSELLDRAAGLGCNAFRLSLEWARLQPASDRHVTIEPDWDAAALDRYAEILVAVRDRGMEPIVTLLHFTHPWWCGEDFWLRPDAPDRFASYARRCVDELGRRLEEPVRWWITINEPQVVPLAGHLLGHFPAGHRGIGAARRALDHTVAAHVRAYDGVHDVYASRGWPEPLVSTNLYAFTAVALDAVLAEALLARERGVPRDRLGPHLRATRKRARRRLASVPRRNPGYAVLDAAADRLSRLASLPLDGAAVDALYRSPRPRKLDAFTLDVYDPVTVHFLGPATGRARRLRTEPWFADLWEQDHSEATLAVFLRQAHLISPDRPILLAENGMCTPGMRPRPDGLRRDDFLRLMCREVVRARDEGIDVRGYVHWTLVDNYEWGSYTPRFGLFGVDRTDGVRIMDTDATGVDAASVYREVVAADVTT